MSEVPGRTGNLWCVWLMLSPVPLIVMEEYGHASAETELPAHLNMPTHLGHRVAGGQVLRADGHLDGVAQEVGSQLAATSRMHGAGAKVRGGGQGERAETTKGFVLVLVFFRPLSHKR